MAKLSKPEACIWAERQGIGVIKIMLGAPGMGESGSRVVAGNERKVIFTTAWRRSYWRERAVPRLVWPL